MSDPAKTIDQNILPVQALFNLDNSFNTFIGQGQPFYATTNPSQTGLNITNSTINSTTIGATTPSTGVFTNMLTTTGQVTTTPSGNTDIANKFYVDTVAQGLGPKAACKCATTANITLSGLQTIDGYTTLAGDRVLVKNQSSNQFNGIYNASAGAWTRSTDMDVWSEVPGAYTVILNGVQANTAWVCTSSDTGTIDVTPITFVLFSGISTYTAGTGLTLAANQFSITNTGVTAASYGSASQSLSATVNAQGQLTSLSAQSIAIGAGQVTSGTFASSLLSGSYTGITGVGTLTAGTWNGSTIGVAYGGTGANTFTAGYLKASGTSAFSTVSFIPSSDITGLGTMSTQNANNVNITGGTIALTTPLAVSSGGSGATTLTGYLIGNGTGAFTASTTIPTTALSGTISNAQLANSSVTINGSSISLGGSATITANTTNALTIGTGLSGTSFNGSAAVTIANTGVLSFSAGTTGFTPSTTTTGAVTLGGLLSLGSGGTNANLTAVAGGILYSGASALAISAAGTTGQFLQSNGAGAPTWATPVSYATVTDDTTTAATRYPLFANQTSGSLSTEYTSSTKLQYNPSTGVFTSTSFTGAGTGLTGTASSLSIGGNATTATSATSATTATNLAGGANGSVPYQTGSGATAMLAAGTNGQILTLASGIPSWAAAPATGVTITDDTSSATAYYPLFARVTTGTATTEYTSSTKLNYTPSTGLLSTTSLSLTNALSIANGGTGLTTFTSANNALYSTSASALAAGTLPVAAGGTGLTTLTANYIPYGNGTSAYQSSSIFTFNGTTFSSPNINVTATTVPVNGMYLPATNSLGWATNTTSRMTLFASGGLSLGNTTDPGATNLSVTGTTTASSFIPSSSTVPTNGMYLPSTNAVGFATASTNRMTIDASGNLALGNTSVVSGYKLDVNGQIVISSTTTAKLSWSNSGNYLNWIECGGTAGANYMRFATGNAEAMRIFSSGGVSIGNTTDPGATNLSVTGTTTSTGGIVSTTLNNTNTITVKGSLFTLQDATDTTKQANFDLSGLTTGTTYSYKLPAVSGAALATLGNISQTFSGNVSFAGSFTSSGSATINSSFTNSTSINSNATTATLTMGGTSNTGTITLGQSTVSQTVNISNGATASGSTKTLNIGTGGLTGSTTAIAIGSTAGTSTTTINGILKQQTYTVATLPSAATSGTGARSFVTDALAPAFGATVVTGGAVAVPVYSDGTNWKVG